MAQLGADVEQLDQLARTFRSSASTLTALMGSIDGGIRATWWVGAYADDFRVGWSSRDRARVEQVSSRLEQLASRLVEQANQQRQASDDLDGGGGQGFLGGVIDHFRQVWDDAAERGRAVRASMQALEGMTADERAAYWESLGPELQAALLAASPAALMLMQGLPASARRQAERRLAQEAADEVVIETTRGFIDAEVDILSWEAEGRAEAAYRVFGDGHVEMELRLEAGLGREIEVGGATVEGSAGGTTNLKLRFDSEAEAQAFLDGLDDAAFDLGWGDLGSAPAAVAQNVAEYVMDQDIEDARLGVYGEVAVQMEGASVDFDASGRIEGYYDVADGERGLILSGQADLEVGGEGPEDRIATVHADVQAEITMDENNNFDKLQIKGTFGGDAAAEVLGIDAPGLDVGSDVRVNFIVDRDNPAVDQIMQELSEGDVGAATALATENAEIHVQQTAVISESGDEHDISVVGQGVEIEYGLSHSTATSTWVRPAGGENFHELELQP